MRSLLSSLPFPTIAYPLVCWGGGLIHYQGTGADHLQLRLRLRFRRRLTAGKWLVKLVEHRLGDQRGVRHIRQWLKAGWRMGPGDSRPQGRRKGVAPVRSSRTSPCTRALIAGPRSGAAGMHGEMSLSCGTATIALLASSPKTTPSSFCAPCGTASPGFTAHCTLPRRVSLSAGVGPVHGARGVVRGNRNPSIASAVRLDVGSRGQASCRCGARRSPHGCASSGRRSNKPGGSGCTGPAGSLGHGSRVGSRGLIGMMEGLATCASTATLQQSRS
jgi:hypothetical protein